MDKSRHDPLFHRLIHLRIKTLPIFFGNFLMGQGQYINAFFHRPVNRLDHRIHPLFFTVRHISPQRINLHIRRNLLQRLRHPETMLSGMLKIIFMIAVRCKILSTRIKFPVILKGKSPVQDPYLYARPRTVPVRLFYIMYGIIGFSGIGIRKMNIPDSTGPSNIQEQINVTCNRTKQQQHQNDNTDSFNIFLHDCLLCNHIVSSLYYNVL